MNQLMIAQTETYEPGAAEAAIGLVGGLVYLVLLVVLFAAMWKIFVKAGKPGWASIVPIYNIVVLLEIVGRPVWWIVMLLIPFVNFVFIFILMIDLAKSFGKSVGFALGLIFISPVFLPILGFGSARYQGPAAAAA
jgi:hypothetical protein